MRLDSVATSAGPATGELVRDLASARALTEEWEELADAAGVGPLSRPAYALSWWEHLGRGRLLVAVVREQGRLTALAALHERRVGPVTVARWLGHGLGTVTEPLVRPGHDAAGRLLWEALAARGRVLDLVECRAGAPGLAEVAGTDSWGRRTRVRPRDVCLVADLAGDGLGVLRGSSGKNLRKNLKRTDHALAREGLDFRMVVGSEPEGFEALLPDIRTVFDAAEAARPRQHLLRPPFEDFVLDYLRTEVARGRAVACVGYLGDRAVVFMITLVSEHLLSLWITRFDPAVSRHRPGHLLWRETYRWAAGRGLCQVDLLLGESQNKRQWATGCYDTVEISNGTPWALAVVGGAVRAAGLVDDLAHRRRRR